MSEQPETVETKTNSNALISLVLGILSLIIPLIGVILGVIGIILSVKAKKAIKITNENGNGLAIAGLICSVIGILLNILAVVALIVFFIAAASEISTYSTY